MSERISSPPDRIKWNDDSLAISDTPNMARKKSTPPHQLSHRWFLAEWAVRYGKKQADAQRDMGWPKATASDLWNSKQRYTQDLIDQVSAWLGIKPHELLMPPNEALALRRLRESAAAIVAEQDTAFENKPPGEDTAARDGTRG